MSATELSSSVPITGSRRKRQPATLTQQRQRWGIAFLMPWLIGFIFFQALPILATVFLSFTNYSATKEFAPGNFDLVGFDNYRKLFNDPVVLQSLGVTLKFVLISVPLGLITPLCFAL